MANRTIPSSLNCNDHLISGNTLSILAALSKGEGSFYQVRMSVQNLGKMDMYQWLYFMALLTKSHIAQIEQVFEEWHRTTS